ncbi:MAG: type II toxin-antitoxin system prevent-host-death family antitoxin [Acidobacteria bacterium]|nr:type II toxin-antitoxin system prevent-host-death family antitoxin [Acidobacteriota bacterium]
MMRLNISDAKTHLSRYLERVERGETILLCRRNLPIAEIRPLPGRPSSRRPVGMDRGLTVPPEFFDPLPDDILAAFEGGKNSE